MATPLTTTFVPSPSCLSRVFFYTTSSGSIPYAYYYSLGPPATTDCLPSGWDSVSQYFSPGFCPSGYTIACSTTTAIGQSTETQATCCPSSYHCQTRSFYPWFSTNACENNDLQTTASIAVTISESGISSSFYTTFRIDDAINAYGISIRFQSVDFATTTSSSFSSSASPSISPTASSTYSSSSTTSTASSASSSTSSPTPASDLSTGAKVGIGVGVSIAGLSILAAIVWFLFIKRKARRMQPSAPTAGYDPTKDTLEMYTREPAPPPRQPGSISGAAQPPPNYWPRSGPHELDIRR